MNLTVTLSQDNNTHEISVMKMNGNSLNAIYNSCMTIPDSEWLDQAVEMARKEMYSDRSELIKQTKEIIDNARKELKKSYPIRYRLQYLLNPIKAIWQLILK